MKRIKLLIVTLLTVLFAANALAQNIKVSGSVMDKLGPVPGATVRIDGTTTGTNTDLNGMFSIQAPSKGILLISCIGYKDVTMPVNGRSRIDIVLEEDTESIEETIVIGYGSGQKIGNLVGSVTTVKSETIKNAPSASALDLLQGQVAGLSVLTTGGVAGDNNVSMTLHGVGSLTSGTAPLFVIDGIPSSSRAIMAMNPNDILSVSVLKDASATSIYGSRAANGVVYVTTKTGSYSTKATVTLRSQYGISTLADFTMYDNMMTGPELADFWVRSGVMTYADFESVYTDHGYTADTKWLNYFQQFNNPQYQNDVMVEGGGQKVAYMVGASQFHQRGNTFGNVYDRYTVRSNVQARPKDWLKLGLNINFSYDTRTANNNWGSSSSVGGNNYGMGGLSFYQNPLYPAIDPVTGYEYAYKYPNGLFNSKYYFENNIGIRDRYGLIGGVFVEVEPIRNLKIMSRAGLDASLQTYNYRCLPSFAEKFAADGAEAGRSKSSAIQYSATITNTIEYTFNINRKHRFSVLAGQEGIFNNYDYFWAYSANQTDDRLLNLTNGPQSTFDLDDSYTQSSFLSFFGHADYSLNERYIFDASFRYDASSRFGRDKRWAPFWAIGAKWRAKNEEFLRNVWWINDLNFKLSYGTQGNSSIGDYVPYATIGSAGNYANATSLAVTNPSNYKLTWEQQGLFTANVNGRLFNFIDFEFEFYDRRTSSMLMGVPQPYTTGFTTVTSNVGTLLNTGVDITLGLDILKNPEYFFRINTTFNYNYEAITELFDGRKEWEIANTGVTYVVGQPINFYWPIYAGVDPEDGKQMWYVPGEDRNVTTMDPNNVTKEFNDAELNQNTGKRLNAPINGGFGLSGGWKNISFQADFAYVLGKYLWNNDGFFYLNPNQFPTKNQSRAVTDFWTPENKYAQYPDWSTGATMQADTHLLENASFLRLKSLLVAYSLPKRWLNWTNGVLKDFKLTFTGRNLFILTNYKGTDPEADSNMVLGLPGSSMQVLGGVEITF